MKSLKFAVAVFALAALNAPAAAQGYLDSGGALVKAVRDRDGDKLTQLLKDHANLIDAKDDKGDTALIVAIARGDEEYTAFLLNKGADPNAPGHGGDTPLIAAARAGFVSAVDWLIGQGAKVDATNRMGETALIVAVEQHQVPIVRALLGQGANPDKTDNAAGYSARDYAARDNRARDILKMIEAVKPKPAAPARG